MRILIEGETLKHYLAKCHEAFRTGMRAMLDARCFGRGYPGYWPFVRDYSSMAKRMFPDEPPDVIIGEFRYPKNPKGFAYKGMLDAPGQHAFVLGDYWYFHEGFHDDFIRVVEGNGIDWILTYFPQAEQAWAGSSIASKFIYLPPSFDPQIFNDWQMPKVYDVGFLGVGTVEPVMHFYPERHVIHKKLLARKDLKYLYASHPGWGPNNIGHPKGHPLVGKGFSQAINSCRMFVTTSGRTRNAHAKYVEILASKSMLMADEPIGADVLQLKDGVNYVKITAEDILDKVDYYLARPELVAGIAQRGYETALRRHSCYARAFDFCQELSQKNLCSR